MRKQRKPKRRKRQTPATQFEFTVAAKDAASLQQIMQKGQEYKLKSYGRGSANNRLYFQCTYRKWREFVSEIKHFCVVDGTGQYPGRIRRRILWNLRLASRIRIDLIAARIAKQLLAVIGDAEREHAGRNNRTRPLWIGYRTA